MNDKPAHILVAEYTLSLHERSSDHRKSVV